MKYEVFYWSVVDDRPDIPFGCANYEECYQYLKLLNVDGIISDFALNCKKAIGTGQAWFYLIFIGTPKVYLPNFRV